MNNKRNVVHGSGIGELHGASGMTITFGGTCSTVIPNLDLRGHAGPIILNFDDLSSIAVQQPAKSTAQRKRCLILISEDDDITMFMQEIVARTGQEWKQGPLKNRKNMQKEFFGWDLLIAQCDLTRVDRTKAVLTEACPKYVITVGLCIGREEELDKVRFFWQAISGDDVLEIKYNSHHGLTILNDAKILSLKTTGNETKQDFPTVGNDVTQYLTKDVAAIDHETACLIRAIEEHNRFRRSDLHAILFPVIKGITKRDDYPQKTVTKVVESMLAYLEAK